jgi:hypothetical protein
MIPEKAAQHAYCTGFDVGLHNNRWKEWERDPHFLRGWKDSQSCAEYRKLQKVLTRDVR